MMNEDNKKAFPSGTLYRVMCSQTAVKRLPYLVS